MIGNDIVDLRDRDARPESFRARFDERVFAEAERRDIAADPAPLARRWAHWAAKEAAYKLARQVDPTTVFTPSRLLAEFTSLAPVSNDTDARRERRGRLELPKALANGVRTLELRSFETSERVHVVAVPLDSDWGAVDLGVDEIDPRVCDPSVAVRAMAIREMSRSLGVAAERLTIGRDGRIPTVELDGARTSLALSLSHHGRWIAYAMRLRVELQNAVVSNREWPDLQGRLTGRVVGG